MGPPPSHSPSVGGTRDPPALVSASTGLPHPWKRGRLAQTGSPRKWGALRQGGGARPGWCGSEAEVIWCPRRAEAEPLRAPGLPCWPQSLGGNTRPCEVGAGYHSLPASSGPTRLHPDSQQAMSSSLQWIEGTHRLEEPVSKTTVKHCGGVPMPISP